MEGLEPLLPRQTSLLDEAIVGQNAQFSVKDRTDIATFSRNSSFMLEKCVIGGNLVCCLLNKRTAFKKCREEFLKTDKN